MGAGTVAGRPPPSAKVPGMCAGWGADVGHLRRRPPGCAPGGAQYPATFGEGPRDVRRVGRSTRPPSAKVPGMCVGWGAVPGHLRRRSPGCASGGAQYPATFGEGPRDVRRVGRSTPPPSAKVPGMCAGWDAVPRHLRRRSPGCTPCGRSRASHFVDEVSGSNLRRGRRSIFAEGGGRALRASSCRRGTRSSPSGRRPRGVAPRLAGMGPLSSGRRPRPLSCRRGTGSATVMAIGRGPVRATLSLSALPSGP